MKHMAVVCTRGIQHVDDVEFYVCAQQVEQCRHNDVTSVYASRTAS